MNTILDYVKELKIYETLKKSDNELMKDILDLMGNHERVEGTEYNESYELHEVLDYDGSIHELVDYNIDIYYQDLRQWSVDNYNYVEEAMDEGLCEGVTDFHKLIQSGQYVYFQAIANNALTEIADAIEEVIE